MKTRKMSLVVVLALALSLGLAASSWARPCGGGRGAMNLTPDQAGKFFDLKEKFRNDTVELRKKICVNRAEMAALWKAEKPDENGIQAKQKELNDLRGQLQQKRVTMRLEAQKISPELARFGGSFRHPHGSGRGPGSGMAPGGGKASGGPGK